MKKRTKAVMAVIGVIFAITGGFISIPLMLRGDYFPAGVAIAFLVAGLIMFAAAFGDY